MATLSQDLASIRKGQKKSIKDVYESSRIPVHIIEQIENGTIFENYANNPVYLRSFLRTYAKTLKISEPDIVKAIDDHLTGYYSGFLTKRYSEENIEKKSTEEKKPLITDTSRSPQEPLNPEEASEVDEDPAEKKNKADQDTKTSSDRPRKKFFTPESLEIAREKSLKDIEEEDEEITSKAHTSTVMSESSNAPGIDKVDWATMVKKGTTLSGQSPKVIFAVIAVLVILIVAVLFYMNRNDVVDDIITTTEMPASDVMAPQPFPVQTDTSDVAPVDRVSPREPETAEDMVSEQSTPAQQVPVMLGSVSQRDTLEILIYAYTDKLEPFFIGLGNGTANLPYWIEQGTAMRVQFTEEINIRGQFSRMRVIFNGNPVPDFMDFFGENRTVSIPRAYFDEDERWATPMPESEWGFSPPELIIDRP